MSDHEWPAELESDARCERCGLRYGEWSAEDPDCRPARPRMSRLSKRDWQVINEALTLYETEHEGEEPDEFADDEAHARWHLHMHAIESTRDKVHDRLDRYANPYVPLFEEE